MDKLLDTMHQDIKEIKVHVQELVKQGVIHNEILKEHEKRSTNLETRILPLEDDFKFRNKAMALLIGSGGLMALIALAANIYRLFH